MRPATPPSLSDPAEPRAGSVNPAWLWLLPELRRLPPGERAAALARARSTPLDTLEWVVLSLGLIAVTALTRHTVPASSWNSRFELAAWHFGLALPLVTVVVLSCHGRRLRRGVRQLLQPGSGG